MITALILTPAALAAQPNVPQNAEPASSTSNYNWETQTGSPKGPWAYGTMRGTQSYVGGSMTVTIEDWNSD